MNFTLSTVVSNRSETVGSAPVELSYYCSQDPTIDPSDKLLARVRVEALAGLVEALNTLESRREDHSATGSASRA